MQGRIHSEETFGTLDGPGVRYVLFLQGCPMRCAYCHNPDTQSTDGGQLIEPAAVIERLEKNRPFYQNGGLTVSGGEPLLQTAFVTELFSLARAAGFHTCLDTSGICYHALSPAQLDALLAVTDLVLLDIKHTDPEAHLALTGHSNAPVLDFARALSEHGTPTVIRHVLVPGLTDREEHLVALAHLVNTLSSVQALELLPYHTMGRAKYEALGRPYPLPDVPPATEADVARARAILASCLTSPAVSPTP